MATLAVRLIDLLRRKQTLIKRALAQPKVPPRIESTDVQGLVFRGHGGLKACRYVLLQITGEARAHAWLLSLAQHVTDGATRSPATALHVAFTYAGLARLGLPEATLAGFSQPFIEGMTTEHRSRLFGDQGNSDPKSWAWGGPSTETVHAVLILYAASDAALSELYSHQRASWSNAGWAELTSVVCSSTIDREHFGFADGISQPAIEGYHESKSPLHVVKAGEFVLGYPNEYDLLTSRPLVASSASGAEQLPLDVEAESARDLGRNGTYLVIRQLRQDVVTFRSTLDELTQHPDGSSNPEARALLAAKWVGRWPSGASLVKTPWKDEASLSRENEFGYHKEDPSGLLCPVGAHVRRANPRDSLEPNPGTEDSMGVNRRHRLIRRGRVYGKELAPGAVDQEERGLMFVAINANIARQFEFIQHSWLSDPRFSGLRGESDPICGTLDSNCFTQQHSPVRRRYTGLPRFVSVAGGAYFFLPGIRALKYLATLGGP